MEVTVQKMFVNINKTIALRTEIISMTKNVTAEEFVKLVGYQYQIFYSDDEYADSQQLSHMNKEQEYTYVDMNVFLTVAKCLQEGKLKMILLLLSFKLNAARFQDFSFVNS